MRVEIVPFTNEFGQDVRGLAFDGVLFEWAMDPESLAAARNSSIWPAIQGDIRRDFLEGLQCFFGGRPVTLSELNTAIKKGEI